MEMIHMPINGGDGKPILDYAHNGILHSQETWMLNGESYKHCQVKEASHIWVNIVFTYSIALTHEFFYSDTIFVC